MNRQEPSRQEPSAFRYFLFLDKNLRNTGYRRSDHICYFLADPYLKHAGAKYIRAYGLQVINPKNVNDVTQEDIEAAVPSNIRRKAWLIDKITVVYQLLWVNPLVRIISIVTVIPLLILGLGVLAIKIGAYLYRSYLAEWNREVAHTLQEDLAREKQKNAEKSLVEKAHKEQIPEGIGNNEAIININLANTEIIEAEAQIEKVDLKKFKPTISKEEFQQRFARINPPLAVEEERLNPNDDSHSVRSSLSKKYSFRDEVGDHSVIASMIVSQERDSNEHSRKSINDSSSDDIEIESPNRKKITRSFDEFTATPNKKPQEPHAPDTIVSEQQSVHEDDKRTISSRSRQTMFSMMSTDFECDWKIDRETQDMLEEIERTNLYNEENAKDLISTSGLYSTKRLQQQQHLYRYMSANKTLKKKLEELEQRISAREMQEYHSRFISSRNDGYKFYQDTMENLWERLQPMNPEDIDMNAEIDSLVGVSNNSAAKQSSSQKKINHRYEKIAQRMAKSPKTEELPVEGIDTMYRERAKYLEIWKFIQTQEYIHENKYKSYDLIIASISTKFEKHSCELREKELNELFRAANTIKDRYNLRINVSIQYNAVQFQQEEHRLTMLYSNTINSQFEDIDGHAIPELQKLEQSIEEQTHLLNQTIQTEANRRLAEDNAIKNLRNILKAAEANIMSGNDKIESLNEKFPPQDREQEYYLKTFNRLNNMKLQDEERLREISMKIGAFTIRRDETGVPGLEEELHRRTVRKTTYIEQIKAEKNQIKQAAKLELETQLLQLENLHKISINMEKLSNDHIIIQRKAKNATDLMEFTTRQYSKTRLVFSKDANHDYFIFPDYYTIKQLLSKQLDSEQWTDSIIHSKIKREAALIMHSIARSVISHVDNKHHFILEKCQSLYDEFQTSKSEIKAICKTLGNGEDGCLESDFLSDIENVVLLPSYRSDPRRFKESIKQAEEAQIHLLNSLGEFIVSSSKAIALIREFCMYKQYSYLLTAYKRKLLDEEYQPQIFTADVETSESLIYMQKIMYKIAAASLIKTLIELSGDSMVTKKHKEYLKLLTEWNKKDYLITREARIAEPKQNTTISDDNVIVLEEVEREYSSLIQSINLCISELHNLQDQSHSLSKTRLNQTGSTKNTYTSNRSLAS